MKAKLAVLAGCIGILMSFSTYGCWSDNCSYQSRCQQCFSSCSQRNCDCSDPGCDGGNYCMDRCEYQEAFGNIGAR